MTLQRLAELRLRPHTVTPDQIRRSVAQAMRLAGAFVDTDTEVDVVDEVESVDDDEYEEKLPEILSRTEHVDSVRMKIMSGAATADEIVDAVAIGSDSFVDSYTTFTRDQLLLTCINYGIDPSTGRADKTASNLILQGLRSGLSEEAALRFAYMAAHSQIPAQMLRDNEFVEQIASTQNEAKA